MLGYVYGQKKQYEQAIAEGERAIALDPNYAEAYLWLAEILNLSGQPQKALGIIETAMRLNPRYPPYYLQTLGRAYSLMGRFEEAIAALRQAVSRNPNLLPSHVMLVSSYLSAWVWQWSQDPQTLQRAFESVQRALALNDSLSSAHGTLGLIHLWGATGGSH